MHRSRGIQNILLRRVRRHQSITALFRSPHTHLKKYSSPPWTTPVTQTQLQDSSLDEQAHISDSSIHHNTPARPTVARQAVSTSTPAAANSESPKSPSPKEISSSSDPIWKRLQTIFHKHQEQGESQILNKPDESIPSLESITSEAHPAHSDKAHANKLAGTASSDKHALSFQDLMTSHPPSRSIQRSPEKKENKAQSDDSQLGKKNQSYLSIPAQTESKLKAESGQVQTGPISTKEMTEAFARAPATAHLPQQSVPFEAVWNVQRVEASHSLVDETVTRPAFGSPDKEEHDTSLETSQAHKQNFDIEPRTAHEGHDHSTETEPLPPVLGFDRTQTSRQPAEVLPPSGQRPSRTDLHPTRASIQRQIENSQAAKEMSETPPVNTVIGLLPADLWWLLGEGPPSSESAFETNNKMATGLSRMDSPQDQSSVSGQRSTAETFANTTFVPNMIQRQTVSDEPLPSNRPKQVSSPPADETSHTKLDLDDLTRRVYAEVRRRLATEWERMR